MFNVVIRAKKCNQEHYTPYIQTCKTLCTENVSLLNI